MADALICDGIRTPIGRHGGALASVRTDDLAALPISRADAPQSRRGLAGSRRRRARLRQPGGRGQPQRRADGAAARWPAGDDSRRHGQPAVRIGPRRGRDRGADDRSRRGRTRDRRRRREHESRALRAVEGRCRLRRGAAVVRHDHRLALRQSADASSSTASTRCRRPRRTSPRNFGIGREDQDAFALRSQQRALRAQADGTLAAEIVPVTLPTARVHRSSSSTTSTRG